MSNQKQKTISSLSAMSRPSGVLTSYLKSKSQYEISDDSAAIRQFEPYFSDSTMEVMNKILDLEKSTLSTDENIYKKPITLDERLFDARAKVKILLSSVSMHFSNALREKLFRQIDLLHDSNDWEEGDIPIQEKSFNTFLRWFYLNEPSQLPNFGLSSAGYFIASWVTNNNKDTLILEFLSHDQIKWFVTKFYGQEVDHSSGLTMLTRIENVLAPYQPDNWFTEET